MIRLNTYLHFKDNCKEAFDFYRSVFGGEFTDNSTFGSMPCKEGDPPIAKEYKDRIMHITLPINEHHILMGCDTPPWAPPHTVGNHFSISINPDTQEEADKYFNALSTGGHIQMPMSKTFWNAYFGMFTDKFGISWMINVQLDC